MAVGSFSSQVYDKKSLEKFASAFLNMGTKSKASTLDMEAPERVWQTFQTQDGRVTGQSAGPSPDQAVRVTEDLNTKLSTLSTVFATRAEQIRNRTAMPGRSQTIFTR